MLYSRDLMKKLDKWLKRREIYVIKGPRQSGKTTLLNILKEKLPASQVVMINAEEIEVKEAFEKDPISYVKSFISNDKRYYFMIDEFQHLDNVGRAFKMIYDRLNNVKLIATGSSSLKISSSLNRELTGRVFQFELFPFNFHEFLQKDKRLQRIYENNSEIIHKFIRGEKVKLPHDVFVKEFDTYLHEYITFGGYPSVVTAEDAETKKMILKNILNTYISTDVVGFLKFSDAIKYKNIIKILASSIGNIINYSNISSLTNSYYLEVRRVLSMLVETYIINLIHPFSKSKATEIRKAPKIYFIDLGLRNYVVNNFSIDVTNSDFGALMENFAFLQLRIRYEDIRFWRTVSGGEVDFIIDNIPIEVKYRKQPRVPRGLKSFISTYKPKRAVVLTKDMWKLETVGKTKVLFAPVIYI